MNVHAEIITIGDEILIGQTIDTNTAWMGKALNALGVDVDRVVSIRDTKEAIVTALDDVKPDTKLVLMTGGLGPTKDDLTKHVLNDYFQGKLVMNDAALSNVYRLFETIGLEVNQINREQAFVPDVCDVLINEMGTASGMLFRKGESIIISMPGVPYEMKSIMTNHVLPMVKKELITGHIIHETVLTHGVPESILAEMINDWESKLPSFIKLAYLPSPGLVKLRMTAKGMDEAMMKQAIQDEKLKLNELIGDHVYGENEDSLEKVVGALLLQEEKTLSTAESCTGGNIAHRITTIPGSSAYFQGSVVAYHNHIKQEVLNVPSELIEQNGAVSEQVVIKMAEGARSLMQTDFAIATSGVAGPDGGTKEKPVGTVWIAVAGPFGTIAKRFSFGKDRLRNIKRSTFMGLSMLRDQLLKKG